jgi:hypothetical protein
LGNHSGGTIATIGNIQVAASEARPSTERIDLEAQFAIAVEDAREAAQQVRALVASTHGFIASDEERGRGGTSVTRIELLVRVPTPEFGGFADRLAQVGRVEQRIVKVVDATLDERDLETILKNLDEAIARYKELLAKAATPADTLAAEREIERASSDRDRVGARLGWLRDRLARATVAIALQRQGPPQEEPVTVPHQMVGARPFGMLDFTDSGTVAYAGGGLTMRLPHSIGEPGRGLSLDVDILRGCCGSHPERSSGGFMVVGGWDLSSVDPRFSARRWFFPYVGGRVGVSELRDRLDFAAGAVVGVDVFRAGSFMIGAQSRFFLLVGNPDGPHGAVEPALTAEVGF